MAFASLSLKTDVFYGLPCYWLHWLACPEKTPVGLQALMGYSLKCEEKGWGEVVKECVDEGNPVCWEFSRFLGCWHLLAVTRVAEATDATEPSSKIKEEMRETGWAAQQQHSFRFPKRWWRKGSYSTFAVAVRG